VTQSGIGSRCLRYLESELVSGVTVELSGVCFVLVVLGEYVAVFIWGAVLGVVVSSGYEIWV